MIIIMLISELAFPDNCFVDIFCVVMYKPDM